MDVEATARKIASVRIEDWEREYWRCEAVRDLYGGYPQVRKALIDTFAAALRTYGDAREREALERAAKEVEGYGWLRAADAIRVLQPGDAGAKEVGE